MDNVVDRSIKRFFYLLLIVDVMLIAMHLVQLFVPLDASHYLSVSNERSLGEAYRHIKLFWILVLLVFLMFRRAAPLFFVWFIFFSLLLFLDIFELHGQWGGQLLQMLNENNLLPPSDRTHNHGIVLGFISRILALNSGESGELVFATIVAVVMLILLLIGYLNADSDTRRMTRRLLFLSAAYGFFAVVLDYVYAAIPASSLGVALGIIEEAGQLVIISFTLFYLYRHDVWHGNAAG